jgi:hypothetical protein
MVSEKLLLVKEKKTEEKMHIGKQFALNETTQK